jgi:hypothetical protein
MAGQEPVDDRKPLGYVVGGLGMLAVALALVPFRREIDNANLALLLVVVVVLSAIVGDRSAAVLAAITATICFDFFLTRPYTSMRIESADDFETVVIMLAVGLLVGEVAARGRRSRRKHDRAAQSIARVHRVAARVAEGADLVEVADLVVAEMTALLRLHDCRLELAPFQWPLPRLERGGTVEATEHEWSREGFVLPEYGVQLPVLESGREVARLVLIGDPTVAVSLEDRVVAVALADQLGSAFATAPPEALRRIAGDPPRE